VDSWGAGRGLPATAYALRGWLAATAPHLPLPVIDRRPCRPARTHATRLARKLRPVVVAHRAVGPGRGGGPRYRSRPARPPGRWTIGRRAGRAGARSREGLSVTRVHRIMLVWTWRTTATMDDGARRTLIIKAATLVLTPGVDHALHARCCQHSLRRAGTATN